jgi:hypothetical protein
VDWPIYDCGFLYFDLDAFNETTENKHGRSSAVPKVDKDDPDGIIQTQDIGHFRHGEHDHLEGDDHGEN